MLESEYNKRRSCFSTSISLQADVYKIPVETQMVTGEQWIGLTFSHLISFVTHCFTNLLSPTKDPKLSSTDVLFLRILWGGWVYLLFFCQGSSHTSRVAQMVKNLPAMQETQVQSLGWEDPLEKGVAAHSSILAWEIPWTEEPGRLQSMGLKRVGQDLGTKPLPPP